MSDSILVTGGGGFIGTWVLRELLARGLRPVVLDVQKNAERWQRVLGADAAQVAFVAGGLLDRELLRRTADEQRVSHIIHLAALLTPHCQQDPFAGCEINVLGSVALFELTRASAGRIEGFSYASSYAVYGPEADDHSEPSLNPSTAPSPGTPGEGWGEGLSDVSQAPHPDPLPGIPGRGRMLESHSPGITAADNRPPSFYGAFKMAVDLIAEQYWRHFGIASVGIRPHVAYGPERTVGLTAGPSQAARAAALGESYTINYTGRVGYDYVEDVARAFVRAALETPRGATVVDLPSQLATTEEFVRVIDRVVPGAGSRLKVEGPAIPSNIPPKPRYISELFSDWRTTTLEEGVRATVAFYRTHPCR